MSDSTADSAKPCYRVVDWPQYNQALIRRGSFTVWGDQQALDS